MEKGIFNNFYKYLTEHFEKGHLEERRFEPEHLLAKRASAFQLFNLQGLPSVKTEDWKYSNLSKVLNEDFRFPESSPAEGAVPAIAGLDSSKLVFINGKFAPGLSDELPQGITFLTGDAALKDPFYSSKVGSITEDENQMLALNTAFFKDFHVLHVKAKQLVEKPVHLTHLFTGSDAASFVAYRLFIITEELSEATLIESFHSDTTQPAFVSYVTEVEQAASSVFHSHMINELGEEIRLVHHREVAQQRDSIFNNTNLALGKASFIRNDLNFRLKGTGTETNLLGSYITDEAQHVDNHTLVDHQSPHCNSNELYKGIMMDRSHAVFNGKVFVRPDAQKTNAFQKNNNIVLGSQASINSKPQLEIFADDVKCSHGSTVGQMDEDALFYLKTRGIGEKHAKRMLMEAFISDVHSRISVAPLREYVHKLLKTKLQNERSLIATV